MGDMIDKEKLGYEVIEMLVANGLEEPWLMALLDGVIKGLNDKSSEIGLTYGQSDGNDFVCLEIGLLQNVFEVEHPFFNYYLINGAMDFYDKVLSIDMDMALKEGEFQKSLDYVLRYINLQLDMQRLGEGFSLEEFEKRLSQL